MTTPTIVRVFPRRTRGEGDMQNTSWKVTLEHTCADGRQVVVSIADGWQHGDMVSELLCITNSLGFALCALEGTGDIIGTETRAQLTDSFWDTLEGVFREE